MLIEEDTDSSDDHPAHRRELANRVLILERQNRELKGELAALNHGIEGIIDKCTVVLQAG